MGEVERRLEGKIVITAIGHPHYGFDVFTIDLPHDLNDVKSTKLKYKRITDGRSINCNAQFLGAEDVNLLFFPHQIPAFPMPEWGIGEGDEGAETVVFISERTGNARIHLSGAVKAQKHNSLKRFTTGEFKAAPAFFFGRPFVCNGRLFFVSNRKKPGKERDLLSWSAVYSTCLKRGDTIRFTPYGEADYSPSISPCGKWIAVASYGATRDRGMIDIQDLKTDLNLFKAKDGSGRKMVAEQGGWPSWVDENTVYFHKRSEDGWWSIYRLKLDDGSVEPEQITPPSLHAFTPCASQTGKWVAFATRRPETKHRHIQIFDL